MRKLLVFVICIATLAGGASAHPTNAANVKLQIYSTWPKPRTFLGCLNCAATDTTSIWNPTSQYGWTNPDGVWSRPAQRHLDYRHLVCDLPLTAPPPAVFDEYWGFHYVLTVDAVQRDSICTARMSQQGCAVVQALCTGRPVAAVPPGAWTDTIADPGPLFGPPPGPERDPSDSLFHSFSSRRF